MEFPNAGKHCSNNECKQLDFLPLKCDNCELVFCSEHLQKHRLSTQCMVSNQLTENELKKFENLFVCSKSGCKEKSIVPLVCERCNKHYCIKHRHINECTDNLRDENLKNQQQRYAELLAKYNEAKNVINETISNNLLQAEKNPKRKETAQKLKLMKLKNKATGEKQIPTAERIYFNIHFSRNDSNLLSVQPVFVSKSWSLGRCIDSIASECKLQNNNNKINEKKLRLCKNDALLSNNLALNLDKLLLDELVVNGEDLILEYIDNDLLN